MYEIFERLLQKHGITTYQVSKATGISQSTFSNWKNRRNLISAELGKKIADYFDVSLDFLMGNSFIEGMGKIVQEERIKQGLTQDDLAEQLGISVFELDRYESQDEPIREDVFESILSFLGTSHLELLNKYELYDEYIPPQFNGDVIAYEEFKKARDKDAMLEKDDLEDVLLISRAARKMTPENRKKLIEMAKIMFAEDFND